MDDRRYLLILNCLCRCVQVIGQLSDSIGHLEESIEEMRWDINYLPLCIFVPEGDQFENSDAQGSAMDPLLIDEVIDLSEE
jgi:hypothetical protein